MNRSGILFVITKSNWGGAQAYVHTLAARLVADQYPVAVALGGTGLPGAATGQLAERLAADDISTHHLTALTRDLSVFRELRAFGELLATIRAARPSVLHLNSSKAGILGALAGRIAGVPRIIFTAHGWPHREPRPVAMRALIWFASWLTILLADCVIAVSDCDLRTAPVFFSRKKIRMIHNGISPFPLRERNEARTVLGPSLPQDSFWFLMNAELHPNKGIDRAIRALAEVRTTAPAARLIVVGSGEEGLRLASLASELGLSEAVCFPGFLPDARSNLSGGDAYLMPSRKEGLPLALLEAGMAALPAIASATGGIPEVITDGVSGWLVPVSGTSELVAAMHECLANQPERARRGSAFREHVLADFSEDQMYANTRAVYGL